MNGKTLDAYNLSVKAKYESEKHGHRSDYLLNPTPAGIKSLCLLIVESSNSRSDLEIMSRFFNFKEEEDKIRQVKRFDTDRLKPVCNFLKGKTEFTQQTSLDLIAVLVDFSPRPFSRFYREATGIPISGSETVMPRLKTTDEIEKAATAATSKENPVKIRPATKANKYIAMLIILSGSIVLGSTGYAVWNITKPKCMVWNGETYKKTHCNKISEHTHHNILPLNDEVLKKFRKVTVCDTTTFFHPNGHPKVWYGKSPEKGYEFFSHHGLHPETQKTLKPVTPYIINRHILKNNIEE